MLSHHQVKFRLIDPSLLTSIQLENFKECWKQHGNDKRTDMKDA